ncbi:MAG TPA: threonine/serine exporter family protein [Opitutaceae bacterium]
MQAPWPEIEHNAQVNRVCLQMGLLLLQNGAESALIESTTRRLGHALEVDQIEITALANAVIVTTRVDNQTETAVARAHEQTVNMRAVTEAQRIMLEIEHSRRSPEEIATRLSAVDFRRYPDWLVVVAIGLSCACFARLAKADWVSCAVTFLASASAMAVRLKLNARHYSPILNFGVTAFVATALSAQALIYRWSTNPQTAMAASCLLLVPGVPLINGVSDILKGYINMGIARLAFATVLTLASCAGIVLAMTLFRVWAWL